MADNSVHRSTRRRHAHRPTPRHRRRRVLLIAVGVLVVSALAIVIAVRTWDRPGAAVADQRVVATATATATAATATGPPATTPAPTAGEAAITSDVPRTFVDAMQQIGIPLDAHTGWVVAQGICVRLGQPAQYDQFKMAEGVERLFPSIPDEQAHAFVAMVAVSVCDL